VPTQWAHRDAVLELFEERVRVIIGEQLVAEHKRCTGKHQTMLDVRHAIELLAYKHRSIERAEGDCDASDAREARTGDHGTQRVMELGRDP
jgi:hypothetical protein